MREPERAPHQPTQRELQAERRRAQLIETALGLFSEKGYEHTSIKDIAVAAGVAQGLIYHYFRSKEDLLIAIMERRVPLQQIGEILAMLRDRPAAEALPMVAHSMYMAMTERRDLLRVFFREAIVNPALLQRATVVRDQGLGMLARYLAGRVAAGELRPHNPLVTAQMLLSSIIMLRLLDMPPEPFISEMVRTIVQGVAGQETA